MSHPAHHPEHSHASAAAKPTPAWLQVLRGSALGWPAWLRVLLVLPLVTVLWLGVWWAMAGVKSW